MAQRVATSALISAKVHPLVIADREVQRFRLVDLGLFVVRPAEADADKQISLRHRAHRPLDCRGGNWSTDRRDMLVDQGADDCEKQCFRFAVLGKGGAGFGFYGRNVRAVNQAVNRDISTEVARARDCAALRLV